MVKAGKAGGGGHVTEEEYAEMLSFEDIFEMVIRPRLMSLLVRSDCDVYLGREA